jgi:hypothetical protein
MTTRLGKILVVLTTALSWSLAVWAYGAYTLAIDWGWSQQFSRKDVEKKRIPSEMDKRKQEVEEARAAAELAQAALRAAQKNLHVARMRYPENHLWYNAQLKLLATGQGKIAVHEIQFDKTGKMMLAGNSPLGLPVLAKQPAPGLNLSEQGLRAELQSLEGEKGQLDVQIAALKKLDKEQKAITERLSPLKGPNGQVVRKGLDDLAEVEAQTQFGLREEMDRLRPLWTRELSNAQLLLERRDNLRRRVEELQESAKAASTAP